MARCHDMFICDIVLGPDFVSSFVYSDNVYFFFREMAVENINCGKVSQVCRCLRIGGLEQLVATLVGWTKLLYAGPG